MELKDFVKKVILDLDTAVSEVNEESAREVRLRGVKEHRTAVEFDVAITVESTNNGSAGGGIKVLGIIEANGSAETQLKNSTVSRVSFGIDISERTKLEKAVANTALATQLRNRPRVNPAR
jgi:hypothetical protein